LRHRRIHASACGFKGCVPALSEMVNNPDSVEALVGLKVTVTVQLDSSSAW
jgi:hypothetical protein